MQGQQAVLKTFLGNPIGDVIGDFVEAAAASRDAQFVKRLEHRTASSRRRLRPIRDDLLLVEHFFEIGIMRMAVGQRFLVMPFGELYERRLLSQVNNG